MALIQLANAMTHSVIADATSTDMAILSVISMAGGYLLLAGLWYFVFSEKAREKRKR